MNVIPLYDLFMYCWFVYDNIKLRWKLDGLRWNYWVVWGSCGRCCMRRELQFWIAAIVWIARPSGP